MAAQREVAQLRPSGGPHLPVPRDQAAKGGRLLCTVVVVVGYSTYRLGEAGTRGQNWTQVARLQGSLPLPAPRWRWVRKGPGRLEG